MGWLIFLHLIGACVWTGGHLVLALSVLPRALRARDPRIVQEFEAGFERLAIPALILQIVTGLWLAHDVLRAAGAFAFDVPPVRMVWEKIVLLVLTVALAFHARKRLVPKLDGGNLGALAWHIRIVTLLAVLLVLVGASLRSGGLF